MAEMLDPLAGYESVPAAVNKYLLPEEKGVKAVRRHRRILGTYATEALGALLIATILELALAHGLIDTLAIWIPTGYLVLQALWAALRWSGQFFVITNQRVLVIDGDSVTSVPLAQLANLRFSRSLAGRLARRQGGFGTFRYGLGARQVLLDYAPDPERLYLIMIRLIFGHEDGMAGQ